MGVAADKASRPVGRLGHWVATITALSCAAFVGLPDVAGAKLGPTALLVVADAACGHDHVINITGKHNL